MTAAKNCLFCGEHKPLIKSHIIPDFLFRDVKGKDGFIQTVNPDLTASKKVRKSYFTDDKFLCAACDNGIFGNWERRASHFLRDKVYSVVPGVKRQFGLKDVHEEKITEIDYKVVKLFLLSILWRAHHSSQTIYSKVDLGDDERQIKEMLLKEDPGGQNEFEISLMGFIDVTGSPLPVVMEPEIITGDQLRFCEFLMGGIAYIINLPGGAFQHFSRFSLKTNGELLLPFLSGWQGNRMLKTLHVPNDVADFFSFRIIDKKGDIISMAKNDHFDVLVNLCPCNEKRKGLESAIPQAFGIVQPTTSKASKNNLGKIYVTPIPVSFKLRKEFYVVDAYIRLDNRNTRPFDTNSFIEVLRTLNEQFSGKTIAMPKTWNGFASWDIDKDKILTILDRELANCRIWTVSPAVV